MKRSLCLSLLALASSAFAVDNSLVIIHQQTTPVTLASVTPSGAYTETKVSPASSSIGQLRKVNQPAPQSQPGTSVIPVLSLGVVPPYQLGGTDYDVAGLRIGLPYAHHNNLRGLDCTLFGGDLDGDFLGLSASGLFNRVGGESLGVQVAGFFNQTGPFTGVQVAGLGNSVKGDFYGVQLSCLANIGEAIPTLVGLQFSSYNSANYIEGFQIGLLNYANTVQGLQLGFFNRAETLCGVQIGFFNSCGHAEGVQIGLGNYIADSAFEWSPILNVGF